MQSKATTVAAYLKSLPPERRAALEAVRKVILANLDSDYDEGMQYGMIGYYVPLSRYPAGYHCAPNTPLPFAGLASQKAHMSVHLMALYSGGAENPLAAWFQSAWRKTGKKLDMGAACVRFKKLEDVALDVLGEAIRRMPASEYIRRYEGLIGSRRTSTSSARAAQPEAPRKGGSRAKPRRAETPGAKAKTRKTGRAAARRARA
jgi:hypothetical protein